MSDDLVHRSHLEKADRRLAAMTAERDAERAANVRERALTTEWWEKHGDVKDQLTASEAARGRMIEKMRRYLAVIDLPAYSSSWEEGFHDAVRTMETRLAQFEKENMEVDTDGR